MHSHLNLTSAPRKPLQIKATKCAANTIPTARMVISSIKQQFLQPHRQTCHCKTPGLTTHHQLSLPLLAILGFHPMNRLGHLLLHLFIQVPPDTVRHCIEAERRTHRRLLCFVRGLPQGHYMGRRLKPQVLGDKLEKHVFTCQCVCLP